MHAQLVILVHMRFSATVQFTIRHQRFHLTDVSLQSKSPHDKCLPPTPPSPFPLTPSSSPTHTHTFFMHKRLHTTHHSHAVSSHFTELDWCQAQQGSLIIPSPFPWLWFMLDSRWDFRNLVSPFMRVATWTAKHSATWRESKLLLQFTAACSFIITLTLRAPRRRHIV